MDIPSYREALSVLNTVTGAQERRDALLALLSPADREFIIEEMIARRATVDAAFAGVSQASILKAMLDLGPGLHRVWQIQQALGLPVGKKDGFRAKMSINRHLGFMRKKNLVIRDPAGGGWSVV
jgi:hypothetical protein